MSRLRKLSTSAFRPAKSRSVAANALRATLQTAGMWGVFLFGLPALVVQVQGRLAVPLFDPTIWRPAALAGFVLCGSLGLYCGWLFVRFGHGTPLPLDQTTRLVVRGPYRHVRNPMAIFGITQGVCVGLWLGSWPVVVYALLGTVAWHTLARPSEERDMLARYGQDYADYAATVRCWWPRIQAYKRIPE